MKRILIVEDNVDLASGLKRNLEHEGHRVAVAAAARAALESAASDTPWHPEISLTVSSPGRARCTRKRRGVEPTANVTAT